MGDTTNIAWTDKTLNWWEGCTKVGPGCDGCYAEARNQRFAGGANWGPGSPRRLTSSQTRNKVFRWNREAEASGYHSWVFCFSLADVFDNEVSNDWRRDFFDAVRQCRELRFQIVTKRIGNAQKMLPADWADRFNHCGIISTMVTQEEVDRDMPKLADVKRLGTKWVGISIEPQIEHVDLRDWLQVLDWVISGGESKQKGHDPRPYDLAWPRSLINQVGHVGVPLFVKQMGSNAWESGRRFITVHSKGEDPREWPEDIRVRQMPTIYDDKSSRCDMTIDMFAPIAE